MNDAVSAGLVPADEAAQMVKDQIADLPLLAALQVAQQRGYADEVKRVAQALRDQREAREQLRLAEAQATFDLAQAAAQDRLAELREELRLVGAVETVRLREIALLKARTEAEDMKLSGPMADAYVAKQLEVIDAQIELTARQAAFNQELAYTADLFAAIDDTALNAARGMSEAFGSVGRAMGDALTTLTGYHAAEERLLFERAAYIRAAGEDEAAVQRANRLYAIRSASLQVGAFGDMAVAAKGFFKEGTAGYQALETAEKAFRAVEFALSVRAIAQDAIETGAKIANSVARTAQFAVEAVVKAIKELPWPLNLVAGAATAGAIAALGVSIVSSLTGGGGKPPVPANEGRGTVFGDPEAQSQSIKRSIDALREVDMLTATYSREMLGSLRSIDSQIGGLANVLIRTGNVDANFDIAEGFKSDAFGKVLKGVVTGGGLFTNIPVIGDILGGIGNLLGSLFGSKKEVTASGLFAGPQTLGSILGGGFDASYFTDVKKTKKFFGIKTGISFSTQYQNASGELENEFTLILRGFAQAIGAAAAPLGAASDDVLAKLNGFVVDIGKIDTRNLSGAELQDRLSAIFGAAADRMASAAFPVIVQFQRAGEGAFETMVRVASSVETVTGLFQQLGRSVDGLDIGAQMALIDQFDGLEGFTSATQAYFDTFYTREEQAQARLSQFTSAFERMGIVLPDSLAGFRALVEAQDLTTAAGRETYAMLLQVAPAFADLRSALSGARSAADILAERQDLKRRLLELQGNTTALRALDLAKLDESNRALQEQIYAIEDAQEAARAAEQLRAAWSLVGDTIADEVRRIRGLVDGEQGGSFATLMGRFNAASAAARGGDMNAAKSLPGLSQALLRAAELAARTRQELDRVREQTASSLEATNAAIAALAEAGASDETVVAAAAAAQQAASAGGGESQTETLRLAMDDMRAELAALRTENNAGHAANASNTGKIARQLDDVTSQSGGDAVTVSFAA